jgi:hypothetical protein
MPSTIPTPSRLRWTGLEVGTLPVRFGVAPKLGAWAGGEVSAGPFSSGSIDVTRPRLDRLTRQEKIVNPDGTPSIRLQTIWQRTMEAIEAAFDALSTQVGDNTALLQEIRAAQKLAQAANDAAAKADKARALETSYTDPLSVLSAASSGTVTVAAHTRVYGDGARVSVDGGSVSGFAPGDYVTVFYEDAARAGGAVSYQGSTGTVSQTGTTHIVGQAVIPQDGQPPVEGASPSPPGYTPRNRLEPPDTVPI